ncbi:MAG: DUF1667 domain-containing protein [Oscillospiraceae bacterium]|jgi:CxxC motif-containing protein|nr:DUF1667 domain-containing protein [Oscillospiraceae bacterium]
MKEVICICCPKGCHLQVDEEHDYKVTGNGCPNGLAYGKEEITNPTRIVTSTVRVTGGIHPRCPVKTDKAVPKKLVPAVMEALNDIDLKAPAAGGAVVIEHVCGTDANIVTTRSI